MPTSSKFHRLVFINGYRKARHRFGVICAVVREAEAPDILRVSKYLQAGASGNPSLCRVSKVLLSRKIKCFLFAFEYETSFNSKFFLVRKTSTQ